MRGANDELRKLLRKARKKGCRMKKTGSGHILLVTLEGNKVYLSSTPRGGCRSIKNMRANMRREGLNV